MKKRFSYGVLQHQVEVYKRKNHRPEISDLDRIFWVLISKMWKKWKDKLVFVKPDTVVKCVSCCFYEHLPMNVLELDLNKKSRSYKIT